MRSVYLIFNYKLVKAMDTIASYKNGLQTMNK